MLPKESATKIELKTLGEAHPLRAMAQPRRGSEKKYGRPAGEITICFTGEGVCYDRSSTCDFNQERGGAQKTRALPY